MTRSPNDRISIPRTLFSFSAMPYFRSTCTSNVRMQTKYKSVWCSYQNSDFFIFWGFFDLSVTIFMLYNGISYSNPHTQLQRNPSIFAESRANATVHRFRFQTASWRKFRISDCSHTSSIHVWHVVILSNMLTVYEYNRTHSVVIMVIKRQICHFFPMKNEPKKCLLVAILDFRFQPIFFHTAFPYTYQYTKLIWKQ